LQVGSRRVLFCQSSNASTEFAEAIVHGLIQIGPLDTQPFASKARASQAHTIVALIKGLQSSPAKESQSADITDDPIVATQQISF